MRLLWDYCESFWLGTGWKAILKINCDLFNFGQSKKNEWSDTLLPDLISLGSSANHNSPDRGIQGGQFRRFHRSGNKGEARANLTCLPHHDPPKDCKRLTGTCDHQRQVISLLARSELFQLIFYISQDLRGLKIPTIAQRLQEPSFAKFFSIIANCLGDPICIHSQDVSGFELNGGNGTLPIRE
jgi:hypothetical protein